MSEQEQLPVCVLCGEAPRRGGQTVYCATDYCAMDGVMMRAKDWRRLMSRPRLAPEHVEILSALVKFIGTEHRWSAAIRAALAALGEG